jgi:hypothetical protein
LPEFASKLQGMGIMNFMLTTELTERLAQIERRLEIVEEIFKTAIGFDSNLSEDTETIRGLIAENPGMSQSGIARIARQRFEMSRSRAIEVLRCGVGKIWRIEFGLFNALLYFPIANGTQAEPQETGASSATLETNHA